MTATSTLKDFRSTKIVTLPEYRDSEIEIYDGILYKDASAMSDMQKASTDPMVVARALACLIKRWNFVDEAGVALPVTEENIKLLSIEAITFLGNECAEYIAAKKKG